MKQLPSKDAKSPKYFLPYQAAYLADHSPFKIIEKSRRVGYTYTQSYEDLRDAAKIPNYTIWFTSADETASLEYIEYIKQWIQLYRLVAEDLGEVIIDQKSRITAKVIRLANGSRINALSSNPTAMRSKGGKVILDEFAHHDNQVAMWAAAFPLTTWGFPIRIISTYNGSSNKYAQIVADHKAAVQDRKRSAWSLHSTDIYEAVKQGLADKIKGRKLTDDERDDWIEAQHVACNDEDTWQQEYCCKPTDEATAYLNYELIRSCEDPELKHSQPTGEGLVYIGWDIARRRHLSVITVMEELGGILIEREMIEMQKTEFSAQEEEFRRVMRYPRVHRAAIDQTGIGEQMVENMKKLFPGKVEGIIMNPTVKNNLAVRFKQRFEDRRMRITARRELREDLHLVKRIVTVAGNIRFDAEETKYGHADRFWSKALANHAAEPPEREPRIRSARTIERQIALDQETRHES